MNNLKITFHGGVGSVTGSNFLLESSETKILIDCGLLQGLRNDFLENQAPFPYDPKIINFLFITHAHMDHIGKVGKLVRDGFRGTIYSTPETKELSRLMLEDALKLADLPLYDENDINQSFSLWQTISYHVPTQIG